MLESRFPRIPGDIGNADTWHFPVSYRVIKGASPQKVVKANAEGLLEGFVSAGKSLAAEGVCGITTSCGFLSVFQRELAEALPVPVVTSALLQTEMVNRMLPAEKRVGILTISASSLTAEHLQCAGVPAGTPIATTEGGVEFTRAILNDEPELDVSLARQDNVEAAIRLVEENDDVGAIILECTNMAPYAADIAAATGLPVYSIVSLVNWFYHGLAPEVFLDR